MGKQWNYNYRISYLKINRFISVMVIFDNNNSSFSSPDGLYGVVAIPTLS